MLPDQFRTTLSPMVYRLTVADRWTRSKEIYARDLMNSKKIREQMLKLCGSICEDDGRDPREVYGTKIDRTKNDEYRHQRLCQQVARTLALVLPESKVELVRELKIDGVVPRRDKAVLTVKIAVPNWEDRNQQNGLLELMKAQEGWLRSEVAAAISRKRVPRLAFQFAACFVNEEEVSHEQE